MNDKPNTEKKPFLTDEDAFNTASDLSSSWNEKDEYNACIFGYRAAAKKANAKIDELERLKWSLESKVKKLREERDEFVFTMHRSISMLKLETTRKQDFETHADIRHIEKLLEQFKSQK